MTVQGDAIAAAGALLARAVAEQDDRSPREAAAAAWRPGGPSLLDLETRIRAERGLPDMSRQAPAA